MFDEPISQTPVQLYKYPGENVTYQLIAAGSAGRDVEYTPSEIGISATVSASGFLAWASSDSYHDSFIVLVREDPCGFNSSIHVTLSVLECPCENGGSCISVGPPTGPPFSCVCPAGFSGVLCQNNLLDECASSPCLNGGTCIDEIDAFRCACLPRYSGAICDLELEEWSVWSGWGACDAHTCVRSRERTCVIPLCEGVISQLQCCPKC